MSTTTIILNPSSGGEKEEDLQKKLANLLRVHGVDAEIVLAPNGSDIGALVRTAIAKGSTSVVAGGGDGTVNAVASVVAGTQTALGVLPLGTLNHFAKDLRIPLDLESAVENLAAGNVQNIDVGEVNGNVFINNSSLGLYPNMVRYREEQQQQLGRSKWLALIWASIKMLGRYPYLNVKMSIDGKEMTTRTPLVFIGNNDYELHGLNIGTRQRLDGGELCLYVLHRVGRFGLVWLTIRALAGRLRDADDFDALCANDVRIEATHKRLRVSLDGEVQPMQPPLHYRIRKGDLRVIAPAPAETTLSEAR